MGGHVARASSPASTQKERREGGPLKLSANHRARTRGLLYRCPSAIHREQCRRNSALLEVEDRHSLARQQQQQQLRRRLHGYSALRQGTRSPTIASSAREP